jgi:hypothetical protein
MIAAGGASQARRGDRLLARTFRPVARHRVPKGWDLVGVGTPTGRVISTERSGADQSAFDAPAHAEALAGVTVVHPRAGERFGQRCSAET